MLTGMARLLTRMARMLTRMTRWLAGSHIIHTQFVLLLCGQVDHMNLRQIL